MTRQQRFISRLPDGLHNRPLGAPYSHYVAPQKLTDHGKRNRRDYYERLWRELHQHEADR